MSSLLGWLFSRRVNHLLEPNESFLLTFYQIILFIWRVSTFNWWFCPRTPGFRSRNCPRWDNQAWHTLRCQERHIDDSLELQKWDFISRVQSPQMDWESENLPECWKCFEQHVVMFSGPLATKKEEEKCSYLLIWWVEQGRDITNIWMLLMKTEGSSRLERCSNHVERKCNPVFSRYKFHKRLQTEAEIVEKFVTDLKHVVRE